jgi:hypothetical protein
MQNSINRLELSVKTTGLSILELARLSYLRQNPTQTPIRPMTDSHGVCGYLCDSTIVLAREYLWQNRILSIQHNLLAIAERNGYDFQIYIANKKRFHHFTPAQIRLNFLDYNMRGNSEMVNFTI